MTGVEIAGVEPAQRFGRIVAHDDRVEMKKFQKLILNVRCADKDVIGLSTPCQVMTLQHAAEKGLARNTGVTESGGVRDYGLFTDFQKEVKELADTVAALRSRPPEIAAKYGFTEVSVHWG